MNFQSLKINRMADLRYNVGKLFKEAFGVNSPIFITEPFRKDKKQELSFKGIETLPEYYQRNSTSWMGTPILFRAMFKGDNYKIYDDFGLIKYIQMDNFYFPPATMFSFRRAKDVVRTSVIGNQGTVKEITGFDDWQIEVKGLCLDEPDISAHEQLKKLLAWEKLADSIGIAADEFFARGILSVVITDFSSNMVPGSPGVISFQMSLIGDEPLELGLRV